MSQKTVRILRRDVKMLKATSKVDINAIRAWIIEKAGGQHYQARYISIYEYTDCELIGCNKYRVHWLTASEIKMQNFYLDMMTHEIVHVTRYV